MTERPANPLGVGHLLDRAVAGYVNAFLPIVAILAVEAVPVAILTAFSGDTTRLSETLARLGRAQGGDPATLAALNRTSAEETLHLLLLAFVGGLLSLFARTAVVIFIDAIGDGRALSIGAALRRALPRWLPQLGLALIVIALFGAVFFALTLGFVFAGVFIAFIAQAAHVPAVVATPLAVIAIIIVLVVTLALSLAVLLVYELAMVGVALDEGSPWRSFTAGITAVFDRRTWRSTLAVAASLFAMSLLGTVFSIVLGGLMIALTHAVLVQVVLQGIVSVLLGGLVQWFIVLYARAVRERRSGDDLIRLAETAPA